MKSYYLKQKSGVINRNMEPIEIYSGPVERKAQLFYKPELNDIPETFNLPTGIYWSDNDLKITDFMPTEVEMPKKERNFKKANNYKIVFDNNPAKCTIYHSAQDGFEKDTIVFDNSFKKQPIINLLTIYYHELGHKFYETEWKADLYAFKQMLDEGYNLSQIKMAFIDTLTLDSWENPVAVENFKRISKYINLGNND